MAKKISPDDLVVHIMNVGHGDNIIIQFPVDETGKRSYGIVDCNCEKAEKTIGYLNKLVPNEEDRSRLKFVCATHPHKDHIKGMNALLKHPTYKPYEFWDSGFRHSLNMYKELLEIIAKYLFSLPKDYKQYIKKNGKVKTEIKAAFEDEDHYIPNNAELKKIIPGIWEIQDDDAALFRIEETEDQLNIHSIEEEEIKMVRVSSGMEWYFGKVRVTALAPSVVLRNKYSTYGIDMNNASIVLRLEHHKDNVLLMKSNEYEGVVSKEDVRSVGDSVIILGGDAEYDSWAQISLEYPQLFKARKHKPLVTEMVDFLNCHAFKVPHHGSMHSTPLEMCEKLKPQVGIVSCKKRVKSITPPDGWEWPRNYFPHPSTTIALKESDSRIITTEDYYESEIMDDDDGDWDNSEHDLWEISTGYRLSSDFSGPFRTFEVGTLFRDDIGNNVYDAGEPIWFDIDGSGSFTTPDMETLHDDYFIYEDPTNPLTVEEEATLGFPFPVFSTGYFESSIAWPNLKMIFIDEDQDETYDFNDDLDGSHHVSDGDTDVDEDDWIGAYVEDPPNGVDDDGDWDETTDDIGENGKTDSQETSESINKYLDNYMEDEYDSLTATVLTDSSLTWDVDALIGLYLLPNKNCGVSFEIIDNDAHSVTVEGDMTPYSGPSDPADPNYHKYIINPSGTEGNGEPDPGEPNIDEDETINVIILGIYGKDSLYDTLGGNSDGDYWANDPFGPTDYYDVGWDELFLDDGLIPGILDSDDTILFTGANGVLDTEEGVDSINPMWGEDDYYGYPKYTFSGTSISRQYYVTLVVTDPSGLTISDQCVLDIVNNQPTYDPADAIEIWKDGVEKTGSIHIGEMYEFKAKAFDADDNEQLTFTWYFGDGNDDIFETYGSTTPSNHYVTTTISNYYVIPENYMLYVKVTDPYGLSTILSKQVIVTNSPPIVSTTVPDTTIWLGEAYKFDATGYVTDDDGDELTYDWIFKDDLDDDGYFNELVILSSSSVILYNFIHVRASRPYTITLRPKDEHKLYGAPSTFVITVSNTNPVAIINSRSHESHIEETVTFKLFVWDDQIDTNDDGHLSQGELTASEQPEEENLDYLWDFGDPYADGANPNIIEQSDSTQISETHVYNTPGTYTVILHVFKMKWDSGEEEYVKNLYSVATFEVKITNEPPQITGARIASTNIDLDNPTITIWSHEAIDFQLHRTHIIDAEFDNPIEYYWDFGDGSNSGWQEFYTLENNLWICAILKNSPPSSIGSSIPLSTGSSIFDVIKLNEYKTATHAFEGGLYTVTLWVRDSHNAQSFHQFKVNVLQKLKLADIPDIYVFADELVFFDGSGILSEAGRTLSYSWDFDDSNGIQEEATVMSPTHIYTEPGDYVATYTVLDTTGSATITRQKSINVHVKEYVVNSFTTNDAIATIENDDIRNSESYKLVLLAEGNGITLTASFNKCGIDTYDNHLEVYFFDLSSIDGNLIGQADLSLYENTFTATLSGWKPAFGFHQVFMSIQTEALGFHVYFDSPILNIMVIGTTAENKIVTNPTKIDTDKDEINDNYELVFYDTNPMRYDTDKDGLDDKTDLLVANGNHFDADWDYLNDGLEYLGTGTDPNDKDTDDDGLWDDQEFLVWFRTNANDLGDDGILDYVDGDWIAIDEGFNGNMWIFNWVTPREIPEDAFPMDLRDPDGRDIYRDPLEDRIYIDTGDLLAVAFEPSVDDGAILMTAPTPEMEDIITDKVSLYYPAGKSLEDMDRDGLRDYEEQELLTNPMDSDSDNDDFWDDEDGDGNSNPNEELLDNLDNDGDAEILQNNNIDDDNDGTIDDGREGIPAVGKPEGVDEEMDFNDWNEIHYFLTSPTSWDTDEDGLPDNWEHWAGLDPNLPETTPGILDSEGDLDSDELSNLGEYEAGTDPNDANTDSDGSDIMEDGWEVRNGYNPLDASDWDSNIDADLYDADNDGDIDDPFTNAAEFQYYIDSDRSVEPSPNKWDTDSDGMPDGWEVTYGLNPVVKDGKCDGEIFADNFEDEDDYGWVYEDPTYPWVVEDGKYHSDPEGYSTFTGEETWTDYYVGATIIFRDLDDSFEPGIYFYVTGSGGGFSAYLVTLVNDYYDIGLGEYVDEVRLYKQNGPNLAKKESSRLDEDEGDNDALDLLPNYEYNLRIKVFNTVVSGDDVTMILVFFMDRPIFTYSEKNEDGRLTQGKIGLYSDTSDDFRNKMVHNQGNGISVFGFYIDDVSIGDGLINRSEYAYNLDPTSMDTDSDTMWDGDEYHYKLYPRGYGDYSDKELDKDGDGVKNYIEISEGTNPNLCDEDEDGIIDGWEKAYFGSIELCDPFDDYDDDGLSNIEEYHHNTHPKDWDTDGDGMPDKYELDHGMIPIIYSDRNNDNDMDGLTNFKEYNYKHGNTRGKWTDGLNPSDPDFDNDGMPDGWEDKHGLDPYDDGIEDYGEDEDSDGDYGNDGDGEEEKGPNWDSDGDGWGGDPFTNIEEYMYKTYPNAYGFITQEMAEDTDGDGVIDGYEVLHGMIPTLDDSLCDYDGDGATNYMEYIYGTLPNNPDTDGDKMPDGYEMKNGLNPLVEEYIDRDADGLTDYEEYVRGTDPNWWDSDGDGMSDGWEDKNGLIPILDEGEYGIDTDWDNDGLTSYDEYLYGKDGTMDLDILFYGTSPNNPDSDGDGMWDYWEKMNGVNALDNGFGVGPEYPGLETKFLDSDGIWKESQKKNGPFGDLEGFYDSFDDVNTDNMVTIGGTWVLEAGMLSQRDTIGDNIKKAFVGDAIWQDLKYKVEFEFTGTDGVETVLFFARVDVKSGDYYQVSVTPTSVILSLVEGGIGVLPGDEIEIAQNTVSLDPANPHTIEWILNGQYMDVFIDTVPVITLAEDTTYTNGRVGIGTFQTSVDFNEIEVLQIDDSPLRKYDFKADLNAWNIESGDWQVQNEEMVQKSISGETAIYTGDANWNDFIYKMKFMFFTGNEIRVYGRAAEDLTHYYKFIIHRTSIELLKFDTIHQETSLVGPVTIPDLDNTWHNLKWEFIGKGMKISIYDLVLNEGVWEISILGEIIFKEDTAFISGKVGIGTSNTKAYFDDINVTGDGLYNWQEYLAGTHPRITDSEDTNHDGIPDGDGMPDGWEVKYGLSPTFDDASGDKDSDGITNYEEYIYSISSPTGILWCGLFPDDPDTDADGLPDGWEIDYDFDPMDDGSSDVDPYGFSIVSVPINGPNGDPDDVSQPDPLTNIQEYLYGTNPRERDSEDMGGTYGDGMHDGYEILYFLEPNEDDSAKDKDEDGKTNLEEYNGFWIDTNNDEIDDRFVETYPNDADTDDDLMPDGWEVDFDLDPTISEGVDGAEGHADSDTLTNYEEYNVHTDPWDSDTDDDDMTDGWEVQHDLVPTDNGDDDILTVGIANDGLVENGPDGNPDDDDLSNLEEFYGEIDTYKSWSGSSNPRSDDSDEDGIKDLEEIEEYFPYKKQYAWRFYEASDVGGLKCTDSIYMGKGNWITYKFISEVTPGDDHTTYFKVAVNEYSSTLKEFDVAKIKVEWDTSSGFSSPTILNLNKVGSRFLSYDDPDDLDDNFLITSSGVIYIRVTNMFDDGGDADANEYFQMVSVELERQGGLDPINPDVDDDGLTDGDEISLENNHLTFPSEFDTDGDIFGDGYEIDQKMNPNPEWEGPINSLILLPEDVDDAEEEAGHFGVENFLVLFIYIGNDDPCLSNVKDHQNNNALEEGANQIIAPFHVLYNSRLYKSLFGAKQVEGADIAEELSLGTNHIQYYEFQSPYALQKVAHISLALEPASAIELIKDLLYDSPTATTSVNHFVDISIGVGTLFNTEDSADHLKVMNIVTPTSSQSSNMETQNPDQDEGETYLTTFREMLLEPNGFILLDNGDGTSLKEDEDGDGLTRWGEETYGLEDNALPSESLTFVGGTAYVYDVDGDGLHDGEEAYLFFSNPKNYDTDDDGLYDGDETGRENFDSIDDQGYTSDPILVDSDGDGINDLDEVTKHNPSEPEYSEFNSIPYDDWVTDPMNPDSDGDTIPDNDEKYERALGLPSRFRIANDNTPTTVTISNVNLDSVMTISIVINVGLEHEKPEELAETFTISSDALSEDITLYNPFQDEDDPRYENPGDPEADIQDSNSKKTSISLTHVVDLSTINWASNPSDWHLTVQDPVSGGAKGTIETFEVLVKSFTNPTKSDTDDDLLDDFEEINLGDDGYVTDPNSLDTDGDGLYDGVWTDIDNNGRDWVDSNNNDMWDEGEGDGPGEFYWNSNPNTADTDHDGVLDGDDIDPIHDIILQVKVTKLKSAGMYSGHNMKVMVNFEFTPLKDEVVDLNFVSKEFKQDENIEWYVSVDIDDSTSEDDIDDIDVTFTAHKAYKSGDEVGDLGLATNGLVTYTFMDGKNLNSVTGLAQGTSGEWGAVWYEIKTEYIHKVKTHIILPEDGSNIYETSNGVTRYTGPPRFYVFLLNIENHHIVELLVPEQVYYDSKLGDFLVNMDSMDEGEPEEQLEEWNLEGLEFSSGDETKAKLSYSIRGYMIADVSVEVFLSIIDLFCVDKDSVRLYKPMEISDIIFTIGLPDEIIQLTPVIAPKMSELTKLTVVEPEEEWITESVDKVKSIPVVGGIFGWIYETVVETVEVTYKVITLAVNVFEALVSGDPNALAQALVEFSNFVWNAIVSFAKSVAEFVADVASIIVTIGLAVLIAVVETIVAIATAIAEALAALFNWIVGFASNMFVGPFKAMEDVFSGLCEEIGNLMEQALINIASKGNTGQNLLTSKLGELLMIVIPIAAILILVFLFLEGFISIFSLIISIVLTLIIIIIMNTIVNDGESDLFKKTKEFFVNMLITITGHEIIKGPTGSIDKKALNDPTDPISTFSTWYAVTFFAGVAGIIASACSIVIFLYPIPGPFEGIMSIIYSVWSLMLSLASLALGAKYLENGDSSYIPVSLSIIALFCAGLSIYHGLKSTVMNTWQKIFSGITLIISLVVTGANWLIIGDALADPDHDYLVNCREDATWIIPFDGNFDGTKDDFYPKYKPEGINFQDSENVPQQINGFHDFWVNDKLHTYSNSDRGNEDSDYDGLHDADELNLLYEKSNENDPDEHINDDGLPNDYITDPKRSDSDNDGLLDGYDIIVKVSGGNYKYFFNGKNPDIDTPDKTDQGSIYNTYMGKRIIYTYDNSNHVYTFHSERDIGTNPNTIDSDDDGLNDGLEFLYWTVSNQEEMDLISLAPDGGWSLDRVNHYWVDSGRQEIYFIDISPHKLVTDEGINSNPPYPLEDNIYKHDGDIDGDDHENILDDDSDNDGVEDGMEVFGWEWSWDGDRYTPHFTLTSPTFITDSGDDNTDKWSGGGESESDILDGNDINPVADAKITVSLTSLDNLEEEGWRGVGEGVNIEPRFRILIDKDRGGLPNEEWDDPYQNEEDDSDILMPNPSSCPPGTTEYPIILDLSFSVDVSDQIENPTIRHFMRHRIRIYSWDDDTGEGSGGIDELDIDGINNGETLLNYEEYSYLLVVDIVERIILGQGEINLYSLGDVVDTGPDSLGPGITISVEADGSDDNFPSSDPFDALLKFDVSLI